MPARLHPAHKVTPTLGTFSVDGDTFTLELAIVAEGMVAGIDLDGLTDTSVTLKDAEYDALRALPAENFAPMLRAYAKQLAKVVVI